MAWREAHHSIGCHRCRETSTIPARSGMATDLSGRSSRLYAAGVKIRATGARRGIRIRYVAAKELSDPAQIQPPAG